MVWTTFNNAARRMVAEILNPPSNREKWNMVFVISCFVAVLTDPFFVYVPVINQDAKCIRLDNSLKIAAVIFLSITDLIYTLNIIFQIYGTEEVTETHIDEDKQLPTEDSFNNVQRMIACWQYACRRNEAGCKPITFECDDQRTNDNIKLLNDACPIDPSDETIFNFGIYIDALESGLVGSTDFSQKLSNCFWWGLRNLSSLGSNLEPSINTWETLFAGLTSVVGLLLFLYLIGKVQRYMQVEGERKDQRRQAERRIRVDRMKGPQVKDWLSKNGLPNRLLTEILEKVVEVDLETSKEVDMRISNQFFPSNF